MMNFSGVLRSMISIVYFDQPLGAALSKCCMVKTCEGKWIIVGEYYNYIVLEVKLLIYFLIRICQ